MNPQDMKKLQEMIEKIVYQSADDIAVSIARSFERLEERIDAAESRLYTRIADLEDTIAELRDKITSDKGEDK